MAGGAPPGSPDPHGRGHAAASRRHHSGPLKAAAKDILSDVAAPPLPEEGALLGSAPDHPDAEVELELEDVELSNARFWQLALFASACFMSSIDWNILSPVFAIGEARFDVGLERINSLSNAWNIYTAPGAILALWLTERAGLRVSLLCGYASGLACAVLAHLACVLPLPPRAAFRLLYLSQAVGATGQPLFLNNVTLLAGAWFSASERDAAVAVSLLCMSFGSVFISAYAPLVVTDTTKVDQLFWWQVPVWAVILGVALLYTADQPPLPPNPAAAVQRAAARLAAKRRRSGDEDDGWAATVLTWRHVKTLCTNANFNILNLSSAIVVSTVYLVATVAGQLLSPCGVSNFDVGLALAAQALFTGIAVVAYIFILRRTITRPTGSEDAAAPLPRATGADGTGGPGAKTTGGGDDTHGASHHAVETAPHPYKAHQLGWSFLAAASIVPVLCTAYSGVSVVTVLLAWSALGLLSGTLVNGALTMEHAAEMTFPLPANVSVNVLAITGSLISFVQVVIGTLLLELPSSAQCTRVDTPFALFCALNAGAGLALLAFLREDYRRAEVEARVQRVADERLAREEAEEGRSGAAAAGAGPAAGGSYGTMAQ